MNRRRAILTGTALTAVLVVGGLLVVMRGDPPGGGYDIASLQLAVDPPGYSGIAHLFFRPCPSPADPAEIVAAALDTTPSAVRIEGAHSVCRRRNCAIATVEQADGRSEQIKVTYSAETGALLTIHWPERAAQIPRGRQGLVSPGEARRQAEQLMQRLWADVPVEMKLVASEPTAPVSVDGETRGLYHRFRWEGWMAEDLWTGDQVQVFASGTTGQPYLYSQRIAPVRPRPEEVALCREAVVSAAIEEIRGRLCESARTELAVEITGVRLVLSSPTAPDDGPAWLVAASIEASEPDERPQITQSAIDAMTGEVLR